MQGPAFCLIKRCGMSLRFYTNVISQASRNFAAGLFIVGLLLIGFGFLVYILRDLFAILASIVFFVAGIGCGMTAVKIFWAQRKLDKAVSDSPDYRENVQIHIEEHQDD
jgi:hypothetical protein